MSFERKYQVFVSSTYTDLRIEREKVQQALLTADCIPIGMETFPPSNEAQWEYIKRTIKQCDYYILVMGGRYGTINPDSGQSYTEQEYRYADEIGIPTVSFLHHDPGKLPHELVEGDAKGHKKLESFRALALSKLVKKYEDANDLFGHVIHAMNELKKNHPRNGWVPAKYLPAPDALKELEALRVENQSLQRQLEELKSGKTSTHAIDSKPNHVAAHDAMDSYIRESLRTSDSVHIKVIAVSLHYSWDFFENHLPIILTDAPEQKKIRLEMEMVSPDHLGILGLRDWKKKGKDIEARISGFIESDRTTHRLIETGRLELSLYQYNNIPHWHGILINEQFLFMGRTRWVIHPDRNILRLTVGEEVYRIFSWNDAFGGPDRIAMFNCWFDYYRFSARPVVYEFKDE